MGGSADIVEAFVRDSSQVEGVPRYLAEGALNHLSDLRGFDAVRNKELRKGFVRNVITMPDGASNLFRNAHGGFILSLVDVAACMAGYTLGKTVVTLQCDCNFLRPLLIGDTVTIDATVIKGGRSTIVTRVDLFNSEGVICSTSLVTLFIVGEVGPDDPIPQPYFPRNKADVA